MSYEEKPHHRRYYMLSEVAQHCTPEDCWMTWFGDVYDLSPLLQQHQGIDTKPIIDSAGSDITHWFDKETRDLRKRTTDDTLVELAYTPLGPVLHVPPSEPRSDWANDFGTPWWKDRSLWIAKLSQKQRQINVVNTLTNQEDLLEVCAEETMEEILERYLEFNSHAGSYTWKRLGQKLIMEQTLEENNIIDEADEFNHLGLPDDYYVPAVHLYFNDDLTVA